MARRAPQANPFSQPAGTPATRPALASWSSAHSSSFASASVPAASSTAASFVSDTPQFSRKKARHIPVEQQRTAAATLARRGAAVPWSHSHSQHSAPASNPTPSSSSSAFSRLVGVNKRRPSNGSSFFDRAGSDGDAARVGAGGGGSKLEAEKASFLKAVLSAGQRSVVDAVEAGKSVFFTGCAGTGKSFLLNYLKHTLPADTTYFTASTGLASVNISGQTLHSFAGVGLGEGDPRALLQRVQVSQHARRRWQSVQILVVDEVSMIDTALFDKLEYIARSIRKNPLPFGGIQLILTGDFLQLPPVKSAGGFCFESRSWLDCVPVTIELQSVFRQDDSSLVSILNSFRRGVVDAKAAAAMQSCINRKFDTTDGIEATELYAMKKQVSEENDDRLAKLDAAEVEYAALDKGTATYLEQLTRSCNAVERLVLKEGAQVMLLKNLTSVLVNGSRGVVVSFDVQESDDIQSDHRRVSPSGRWPRVKFTTGAELTLLPERWDVEVNHKSVASRTQVPLMLAWSLTVHKCQGMTLDRVSLHLGSIFEYGQAYVALSRIRSLDSLSIKDKFPQHVIKAHPKAIKFYDDLHAHNKANGHANTAAQPFSQASPDTHPAPHSAANKPATIPDPYAYIDDVDADMDMSDELIAMAADDRNESDNQSRASQLLAVTMTQRDAPSASFQSATSTPFVRASTLSSLSQLVSSPTALSTTHDASSFTSASAVPTATTQLSTPAATVRRHQLLLKRKTQSSAAQGTSSSPSTEHSVAASSDTVTAGDRPSLPPTSIRSAREQVDLVSDSDDEAAVSAADTHTRQDETTSPPVPMVATEQQEEQASVTCQQGRVVHTQANESLPLAAEKKPSPRSRALAKNPFAPSTPPAQPAQVAEQSALNDVMKPAVQSASPLPPFQAARCTAHDSSLHALLDFDKENEPKDMQLVGGESGLKREQSVSVQWLYRCELGCSFVVRPTA